MISISKISDRIWGLLRGDMKRWYASEGAAFLEKLGLREGQTVVDFGSRAGNYSIPAAVVVGLAGKVYAIDKDEKVLIKLKRKSDSMGLWNIETVLTAGGVALKMPANSVDFIMFYDVLHIMAKAERQQLYSEASRILRLDGILSVYPKHVIDDIPMRNFRTMRVEDVRAEVEQSGFLFNVKVCGACSHRERLNYGCIYNFRKNSGV